jgi:diaminohydroxyphosphoribosylaminopyrimidine deaminase/5-amino-6-(5-phosphoribosylamino)uracil reductase
VLKKRPYVILKMALSKDGFIGYDDNQIWMTNPYADISSHKLRSEIDAILVGTNTAVTDNPSLNTRLYFGSSPLRVIIDRSLRVPENSNIYDQSLPTLIFTEKQTGSHDGNITFSALTFDESLCSNILADLHARGVQKLMVEGGAKTIQSFLDAGLWDEAWLYNTPVILSKGIRAPVIKGRLLESYNLADNQLQIIAAQ